MKAIKIIAAALTFAVFGLSAGAQSTIELDPQGQGLFSMNASVNGVRVVTCYSNNSWNVTMSTNTYVFLVENGYINDADIKGKTVFKLPDGSSTKAATIVIRQLRINDNIIVTDVPAMVLAKQTIPLLIGSSAFEAFGEVILEGNKLTIGYDPELDGPLKEQVDPIDALKIAAEDHINSGRYKEAAEAYEKINEEGSLDMFTWYKYCMVLNLSGQHEKNINASIQWLSAYKYKSTVMDYWIYDHLGDSSAAVNDYNDAIAYYENAIAAYCTLFSTTEKEISKNKFKDESLGATYYSLGQVYAAQGKITKASQYCKLAAKCGNVPAQEFCRKYNMKY